MHNMCHVVLCYVMSCHVLCMWAVGSPVARAALPPRAAGSVSKPHVCVCIYIYIYMYVYT